MTDLGDVATLNLSVKDPTTGLPADATSVALTVTLPDGTTATPSVSHPSTGTYTAAYTPTVAGRYLITWVATGTNAGVFADVLVVDDVTSQQQPIVSLNDVKAHLGIAQSGTDDRLRNFALLASEIVEGYTGRTYRRTVITETHDGGDEKIRLYRTPVQSVTSITELGVAVTAFVLDPVAGTVQRGTQYGPYYRWLPGLQNIVITYVTGPPGGVIPARVRLATLELTRHLWDTMRGGYSIPKSQGSMDDWDPRAGYSIPRRVSEMLDFDRAPGF